MRHVEVDSLIPPLKRVLDESLKWYRKPRSPLATRRPSSGRQQVRRQRCPALERADVQRKPAEPAVEKEVAQRSGNGAERKLLPGNLAFLEQPDLEALRARAETEVGEARAEHHVHLVDLRQADHRVELAELD